MEHRDFVKEYMGVRNAKFTEDLVKKAWRKCRITTETFSADFFPDADFAPSQCTSTAAHLPPSFPTINPLFPVNATIDTPTASKTSRLTDTVQVASGSGSAS